LPFGQTRPRPGSVAGKVNGVALRQILVEGQHMNAVPAQRAERRRHDGRERLAFARLHLDHVAGVERKARDDLLVLGPEAD
jgi:hypothetical protein